VLVNIKTGFLFDGRQVDMAMASPHKVPQQVFLHAMGALFSVCNEITCFFIAAAT